MRAVAHRVAPVASAVITRNMSKYANLSKRPGNSSWFLQKTNDGHEMTMDHPYMKSIYAKNYDRNAYGAYLWSQYRIFAELESAVVPLKDDPCLAPVYDELLHRTRALEVDLQHWLGGLELPSDAKYAKMRAVAEAYVRDLQQEAGDAKALLCHHFLHYNAVLSGGQFLSGQICAVESINTEVDSTGVSFYIFPEVKRPAARVKQYLIDMDTIDLSDEDRDRMVPIMRRVYDDMGKIFDAAHEIAPRDGRAYEATRADKLLGTPDAKEDLRLTLAALRKFDGSDGSRILLSLQGKIIDVTAGAESYGPGGSYNLFAGHDVTRCLAMMDLGEASLDDLDFVPETEDSKKSLESWHKRLTAKYAIVGELVKPIKLTLDELRAFDGQDGGKIFVSLSGRIIDVTEGAASYGPGGSYSLFGGRDVTKNLALMDLSEESLNQPRFVPETEDAKKSLESWWQRLTAKYPHVGEVVGVDSPLQPNSPL